MVASLFTGVRGRGATFGFGLCLYPTVRGAVCLFVFVQGEWVGRWPWSLVASSV